MNKEIASYVFWNIFAIGVGIAINYACDSAIPGTFVTIILTWQLGAFKK